MADLARSVGKICGFATGRYASGGDTRVPCKHAARHVFIFADRFDRGHPQVRFLCDKHLRYYQDMCRNDITHAMCPHVYMSKGGRLTDDTLGYLQPFVKEIVCSKY
jgi:hypothetical protein